MRIEFHYTYILMAISFIMCGYFHNLVVFTSIILVHEFGHYIIAKINCFNVEKIVIYPYGGLTKMNNLVNSDTNKELLVAMAGLVFQIIYYFSIIFLYKMGVIRSYIFNLFSMYNESIFIFNILPIYPLDGSKIFNLLLYKILPYDLSNKMSIYISFFILILLIFINYYKFNYMFILIIGIIIDNIVKYYKQLKYLFNKFLLERYLYRIVYSKSKKINKIDYMYKEKYHLIKYKNTYVTERQMLINRFKKL